MLVETKRVSGLKYPSQAVICYIKQGYAKEDIINKIKDKTLIKQIDWQNVMAQLKDNIRKETASEMVVRIIKENVYLSFDEILRMTKKTESHLYKLLHILRKQGKIFVFREYHSSDAIKKSDPIPPRKFYTTDKKFADRANQSKDDLDRLKRDIHWSRDMKRWNYFGQIKNKDFIENKDFKKKMYEIYGKKNYEKKTYDEKMGILLKFRWDIKWLKKCKITLYKKA